MPNMDIDTLKSNLTNPARGYLWRILCANPLGGSSDLWMFRGQSASLPDRSIGDIVMNYMATGGVVYPGKLKYSHNWDVTLKEGEDRASFKAMYEWSNKVVSDVTGLGSISIKTDFYLQLLNVDGTVALKIKLSGCYPKNMPNVALSQDDEGAYMYATTINFDKWEVAD